MRRLATSTAIALFLLSGCLGGSLTSQVAIDGAVVARSQAAQRMTMGSKVKVRTVDGRTVRGILRLADERAVGIETSAATPSNATVPHLAYVPYETITSLEEDRVSSRWAKIARVVLAALCVLAAGVAATGGVDISI
jgi:hypothetical protein